MPSVSIPECWKRIERWLEANAPDVLPFLPAGVSRTALKKAEETLGYEIPRELKEFLSVHDGSGDIWLHDCGVFMSLDSIIEAWDMLFVQWSDGDNDERATPEGPIKKSWFTREWLPVIDAWTGDHTCLDFEPTNSGNPGQVIEWFHDHGPTKVIAPSFGALIETFIMELQAGLYSHQLNQQGQPYLEYAG